MLNFAINCYNVIVGLITEVLNIHDYHQHTLRLESDRTRGKYFLFGLKASFSNISGVFKCEGIFKLPKNFSMMAASDLM